MTQTTTYRPGTTETSGGRWGVAVRHAVRPGTERASGVVVRHQRATAFCGADVFVFTTGPAFAPGESGSCKRCSRTVEREASR